MTALLNRISAAFGVLMGRSVASSRPINLKAVLEDLPRYPPFDDGIPVVPSQWLVESQADLIEEIYQAAGETRDDFVQRYLPAIERYADWVHLLPASENSHHHAAGGLFRHGLEVGKLSLQFSRKNMRPYDPNKAAQKQGLDARWRFGCFITGLCHDLGKPLSDMVVTSESGVEWAPLASSLVRWAQHNGVERYFVRHVPERHDKHRALNPLVFARIASDEAMQYLLEAGDEFLIEVTAALSSTSTAETASNPLYKVVSKADLRSTELDKGKHLTVKGNTLYPMARLIQDTLREYARHPKPGVNKPGSRLWVIDGSAFLVWPTLGKEILQLLDQRGVAGIPRNPDTIADILEDNLITTKFVTDRGETRRYWYIWPEPLESMKCPPLKSICIADARLVFTDPPPSVQGRVLKEEVYRKLREPSKDEHTVDGDAEVSDENSASVDTDDGALPGNLDGLEAGELQEHYRRQRDSGKPNHDPNKPKATSAQAVATQKPPSGGRAFDGVDLNPQQLHREAAEQARATLQREPLPAALQPHPGKPGAGDTNGQPVRRGGLKPSPGTKPDTDEQAAPPSGPRQIVQKSSAAPASPHAVAHPNARQFFTQSPGPGTFLLALADELANGTGPEADERRKQVQINQQRVVLAYPNAFLGLGSAPERVESELNRTTWLDRDPVNPVRARRSDLGFKEAIVLTPEVSRLFLVISGKLVSAHSSAARTAPPPSANAAGSARRVESPSKAKAPNAADMAPIAISVVTEGIRKSDFMMISVEKDYVVLLASDVLARLESQIFLSRAALSEMVTDLGWQFVDQDNQRQIHIPREQVMNPDDEAGGSSDAEQER
jgi:hypothetical protein